MLSCPTKLLDEFFSVSKVSSKLPTRGSTFFRSSMPNLDKVDFRPTLSKIGDPKMCANSCRGWWRRILQLRCPYGRGFWTHKGKLCLISFCGPMATMCWSIANACRQRHLFGGCQSTGCGARLWLQWILPARSFGMQTAVATHVIPIWVSDGSERLQMVMWTLAPNIAHIGWLWASLKG